MRLKEKEKRVLHMLAPGGGCLYYSKVYSDVTKIETNKLHIMYFMY